METGDKEVLKSKFIGFVDEMSGGVPRVGTLQSSAHFELLDDVGLLAVDKIICVTEVDQHFAEAHDGAMAYMRTIDFCFGSLRRESVMHRQDTGFSMLPEGGREQSSDARYNGNFTITEALAAHSLARLIRLRDSGRLQQIDAAV